MATEFEELARSTIEAQDKVARAIWAAVSVFRGPDAGLRAEALEALEDIARELQQSNARLAEWLED